MKIYGKKTVLFLGSIGQSSSQFWTATGKPTSSHQITINFDLLDPDDEISKLFAMDESDAEKPSTKHKCTCDYDTVIKIRGCQCGGV